MDDGLGVVFRVGCLADVGIVLLGVLLRDWPEKRVSGDAVLREMDFEEDDSTAAARRGLGMGVAGVNELAGEALAGALPFAEATFHGVDCSPADLSQAGFGD